MNLTVVGGGIVGLWVAAEAAKKDFKVTLFEQFEIGHDRGSSHGDSRIFRSAYWEGSEYVDLAMDSVPLWEWLNQESSVPVFDMTGGYYLGSKHSPLVTGAVKSATEHDLDYCYVPVSNISTLSGEDGVAVEEKQAGVVYADAAIAALKNYCLATGVHILEQQKYFAHAASNDVTVFCTGPWLADDPELKGFLSSDRVYCHWFQYDQCHELFRKVFLLQGKDQRVLYGMPVSNDCVKVGWHNFPIIPLEPGMSEDGSPPEYVEDIGAALSKITGCKLTHQKSKGCYFTNSLDENYLIDRRGENTWFVGGLSGHGFKFAPAIGASVVESIVNNDMSPKLKSFSTARFEEREVEARTSLDHTDLMLGHSWRI